MPHKFCNVGFTVFWWAQYLYEISVLQVRSKTFCSSSKECPPPTVGPWNFSKRKILYHVLHMYMCMYIYICMYIDIYTCPWCALWINQLLILWCYKQTCFGTHPQTQPYSLSNAGIERLWLYFPTMQWPQCNVTYTISWPSQCQAVWVGHVKNVMFGNIEWYVGSKTVALFSAVIAA